jgi:ribose-phosphate pyrophosphokinase
MIAMHHPLGEIKIFSCNANLKLADDISKHLSCPISHSTVSRFDDGEINMRIYETVRGMDVFIIQPTSQPVNANLMELLIMIDALKRSSAGRITAVVPYFGYARQDRKAKSHDPISAKLVANLISTAGADRVLTMDLHSPQIQGFFDIPMDHLRGTYIFANYYKKRFGAMKDFVVVSPDLGSVSRASAFAAMMDVHLAICDKRRPKDDMTEVAHFIGEVEGKNAILLDDELSSGGSLINAANTVLERGAKAVYACVTHPKLAGSAARRIAESRLTELVVLDTIAVPEEKQNEKIIVLSVAELFGDAIKCIHHGRSIGELFKLFPTETELG